MSKCGASRHNQLEIDVKRTSDQTKDSPNIFGKFILGITGATAVGLVIVTTPFLTPALRRICLPYVPATEKQIANIFRLAKAPKQNGSTLVDLGSGDGRVVRTFYLFNVLYNKHNIGAFRRLH